MLTNLMQWLAGRFPNAPLHRVTTAVIDRNEILYRRINGQSATLRLDAIDRVLIRTTDQGPFEDDVFYVLQAAEEVLVPSQGAGGCAALLEELQNLPGFDNEAVIAAMSSTDNREFLCWERTSAG